MDVKVKFLFIFLFAILLIPLVSSIAVVETPYNISTTCESFNCSKLNITLLYPNSSIFIDNQPMINKVSFASYQIDTPVFGEYKYYLFDGANYSEGILRATSTGYELTTSNSIIYFIMFSIIFFVFMMIMFFINKLPPGNTRDEEGKLLSISKLKYLRSTLWFVEWFLFIGILYLASNLAFAYLGEQLFAKTLFVLFRIAFGITPVIAIVWIIWFIAKIIDDKHMQKLLNRGMFDEGGRK